MEYEIGKELAFVDHHVFHVQCPQDKNEADFNRELRNWLGQNCEIGWETKLAGGSEWNKKGKIKVWFPMEQTDDVLKFKLAWHPFQV